MALAHQPGARSGAQRVSGEISDERRNHVERPARMAFRRGLERIGWEGRAGEVDAFGIAHVNDRPHRRAGKPVGGDQNPVERLGADAGGRSERADTLDRLVGVDDRAETLAPCLTGIRLRSEEQTSELQSLMRISYAVFCLKKQNQRYTIFKE